MKKFISAVLAIALAFAFCTASYARLVGDVNSDGSTNSSDALIVLQYSVGSIDTINEKFADVNEDKSINSSDALIILQISVGSYKGATEVEDELITTYKKDVIDPIIKTGKYTLSTTVISNEESIPSTIMVNGNDMSVDMTVEILIKTTCRMLVLDGKCYLVVPALKAYSPIDTIPPTSISGTEKADYVKSEYYELNGKTYVVETYKALDGSVTKYYFLDGVWKTTVKTAADGTTTTQRIDKFEAGVNEANFSLKGYNLVDLNKYM